MGGKQSRQQREQKQQQAQQTTEKRKQRKDKKSSKRGARTTTPPEEQQANGTGCNEDVVVVAADVAASDSPVNVTESDGRRCVNEHTVGEDRGEGAGGGSSVTTITICMLKMEPNETSPVEDCPTNGGDDTVGAGATVATGDVDESVEVSTVTPTPTIPASTVGAELLTMAPPRCGCFENGNCSGPTGGQFTPTTTAMSVTAANNTTTHPIVASGPIPTIKKSKCNCNATPILIGTPSSATIDNRLNNNNSNELRLADSGPTVVLTMPGGPTPTTTSSLAAAPSASMPSAASSLTMWSSNLPTAVSSSSSGVASPARSQSYGNFMLTAGGGGDSLAQQLLNRLRHHHHHHHHHHHNHHLMHFLHNHHHHHHGPMDAVQPELASDLATGGSNTPDWRHQVLRQWNPTVPPTASESMYGLSPPSLANRANASGGPVVAPSSSSALISPTTPFMDIDLKDKLEGLELGPRTPNNNHSPQPTVDTTGEHPRTVGECPTCCAMAMAANGGSGSSIGLVNTTTTTGTGVGITTSPAASTTAVYNGNVGEVEEKILNTANQQQTAGSRMSPAGTPPPDVTPPSTESATGSTKAVPSTVASLTAAAAGSSTQSDAGKDDDAAVATRTITAPAAVTAAGRDQIVVDGNSPKQTTAQAASSNVAPTDSVAPTSDSTSTTTVAAASSSTRLLAKTTPATTATTTTKVPISFSTSVASSPGGQCCRKQSPSSGSSSAAATLLHTLSLSGRRSRNSSTTPPCSCTCCCGNNNNNADVTVEPPQSRSAFTNWISGGQKAADRNSTSAVPSSSGSNTKSKKPNWRVSLNCTIRRAAGGGSSSGGGTAGPSGKARSSTTSEKFPVANGGNNANNVLSSTGGDLGHNNNSIASASGSTSHRGSSLISSSVSAKLLKSETDKDDTCVCTAYRKMSESPPPPPQLSGGTVSPGRPLSPPLPTSPATDDPSFIPLNMLSLVASGGTGGGATAQPQPVGMSLPVPAESFSSLLHNHHHHLHHHHHHAMAAAALVAADHHHHPSFFFPTSTAATNAGGSAAGPAAHVVGPSVSGGSVVAGRGSSLFGNLPAHPSPNGVILLSDPSGVFDLASDDFSLEDCDERARIQRELEIREGVDAPPNFHPRRLMSGGTISAGPAANHPIAFFYSRDLMQRGLLMANRFIQPLDAAAAGGCPAGAAAMAAAAAAAGRGGAGAVGAAAFGGLRIHSQVDFIHCLVPDLQKITSCSFYWGKMDRYEAERLLEGKPEGTFLLRDSAQEEFLFSVSFRKYNRSLHARIEQFNHKFSFDSRDPGVYTASTVTGLLEHYKDPSCVMFFEPMLTYPLNRNFSFSLQQLCRAAIVSNTTYDGINELALPKSLKAYLKEYHYRQRVRFRPLDEHLYSNA